MNIAGLSIAEHEVKAAFIQSRFGFHVSHIANDSLKLPFVPEDRTEALRDALLLWKERYGIKGAVIGLDFSYFSHHFIDLPVTSKADMGGALAFELERHLPLSPDEYEYDFHPLGPIPGGEGTRILVLAVRKDKLRWLEHAIQAAELKFLAVRCTDIEIINEFMKIESLRNVIFLTQSGETFYAAGIGENGPNIVKAFSTSAAMKQELVVMADTYNRGLYASGISDHAAIQDLSPRELSFSAPDLLASSNVKRRPVDMDFLPERLRPRQIDYYTYALGALTAVAVSLFFLTSLLAYYKDYSSLSRTTDRINEIKSTSSQLVETKRETELLNAKIRFLNSFQLKRNRQVAILNQVSATLPKDAWLTNYLVDEKGTVEIEGYARRSATIIAPFENSEMFSNVEFTSPVTVREGKERFSIKMAVEP